MIKLTRRRLLQATGWTAAGLTVVYWIDKKAESVGPTLIMPRDEAATAWLQLLPDGTCRMFCPRMDMGQNANTGLAQIVAEELNLPMEAIDATVPDTNKIPPVLFTAGSLSIALFSQPTARAAASLRETMRRRGARMAGVREAELEDAAGGFQTPAGRFLGYAELSSGEPLVLDRPLATNLPLYSLDPGRHRHHVGRPVKALGMRELVTGAPVFSTDVQLPDMLFGRALKPPVRNATIRNLDTSKAESVPGLVRIVREGDFVGVVCRTPGVLSEAIQALDVDWRLKKPIEQHLIDELIDVDSALAEGRLEHSLFDLAHRKDIDWDIDLRFEVQMQTHAIQEPRAAVARFYLEGGKEHLELWTGTQDPWAIVRHAADDLGMAEERVLVHPMRMGGGFGGREHYDVERDAARMARAVGRPVKAMWSREDEFRAGRHRPSSSHRIRLAADAEGRLTDWWHAYVSGYVFLARGRLPGWLLPLKRRGGDLGVVRGATPVYAASHVRVECRDVDFPVDLGVWRALNGAPNAFVMESAMDEFARQLRIDPVDFRLANLEPAHARLAACLRRLREITDARERPNGSSAGRGFACGIYEAHSIVAASADVVVDPETGAVRVKRMCCVQDVGLAVNPDQLRAQIEGNLIWGIGMALFEDLEFADGGLVSDNFHNYPIPRMADIPEFEIEILEPPGVPPAGAGEVALIAAVPAIANAIRDATGIRWLRLPIRPGRPRGVQA